MTKHTPGPWEPRMRGPYEWAIDAPRGDPDIGAVPWQELATVYGPEDFGKLGRDKAKANAHLIAAAPDMYEALRGLVDSIHRGDGYPESVAPLDQAIKAIAKAEGRG